MTADPESQSLLVLFGILIVLTLLNAFLPRRDCRRVVEY